MDSQSESLKKLYGMDKSIENDDNEDDLASLSTKDLLARIPIKDGKVREKKVSTTKLSKKKILFRQGTHIIKDEEDFQRKIVIPELKSRGHAMKRISSIRHNSFLRPAIDILSILDGKNYFTEIKIKATMSTLQKAIGQLVVHQLIQECDSKILPGEDIYQIAFPIHCKKEDIFSFQLHQCLLEKNRIRIIFF